MSVGPTSDGAKVFRAILVYLCMVGALWAVVIGAVGSWLGAW